MNNYKSASIIVVLIIGIFLSFVVTATAGWGGRFVCSECGYESKELLFGDGMAGSFYRVIYCDRTKDFYSILTDFDEDYIRQSYLEKDADKEIKLLKGRLVYPIGQVYSYDCAKFLKIYPCPQDKSLGCEVSENLIYSLVVTKKANGTIEYKDKAVCPRCNKQSLYFLHTLKWD